MLLPLRLVIFPLRDHLPARTVPLVNYGLIVANVVVFMIQMLSYASGVEPSELTSAFGLVPRRMILQPGGAISTVFTSMFMHGDPEHIGFNMLFLWIFGDNVEEAMGAGRYLAFYLVGGLCAAAAQVISDPESTMPMIGASGAIAAVLAAYIALYPRSPISVFHTFIPLWLFFGVTLLFPAWLVIGCWFAIQVADAFFMNAAEGGVAIMAHVGGFLAGIALVRPFMAGRVRLDEYARWREWRRSQVRRDAF